MSKDTKIHFYGEIHWAFGCVKKNPYSVGLLHQTVVQIKFRDSNSFGKMAAPMTWRRLVYSLYTPAVSGIFSKISDRFFRTRDRRRG